MVDEGTETVAVAELSDAHWNCPDCGEPCVGRCSTLIAHYPCGRKPEETLAITTLLVAD